VKVIDVHGLHVNNTERSFYLRITLIGVGRDDRLFFDILTDQDEQILMYGAHGC